MLDLTIYQMRVYILTLIVCLYRVTVTQNILLSQEITNTVWTYRAAKGIDVVHDMCIDKLMRTLASGQWTLKVITQSNIRTYLHGYDHYHEALVASQANNIEQQLLQILKLQVLLEYGGLWIDPSVIVVGSLKWIGQLRYLPEVDTFEQDSYELVLFSTTANSNPGLLKTNEDNGYKRVDNYKFTETAIILALKNSQILQDWIEQIGIQMKVSLKVPQKLPSSSNLMKEISLQAVNSLLNPKTGSNDKNLLAHYQVWHLTYMDYYQTFEKYASSNDSNVVVDYYIKEDMQQITQSFGYPQYFISLAEVNKQLNIILNPHVSTLQFINSMPYLEMLWPKDQMKMECIHFVLNHSLIHTYLISASKLRDTKLIHVYERDILQKCEAKYSEYFWKQLQIKIVLILSLILILLLIKLERIVVVIAYRSITLKITNQLAMVYQTLAQIPLQPV